MAPVQIAIWPFVGVPEFDTFPAPAGVPQRALPFTAIPVANCPVEQAVGVVARLVAVAALPVVDWLSVGTIAGVIEQKEGFPDPAPQFPKITFAICDPNWLPVRNCQLGRVPFDVMTVFATPIGRREFPER